MAKFNLIASQEAVNVAKGYPIEQLRNLGADYIHNHWITFGQTASEMPNFKKNVEVLEKLIIGIVKKEVEFYREAQKNYIKAVAPNLPDPFKKGNEKNAVLSHFRDVYKGNLNNKNTGFGQLQIVKRGTYGKSRFNWTKDGWVDLVNNSSRGLSLKQGLKFMRDAIEGIRQYLELVSKKRNLSYLAGSKYGSKKGNIAKTLSRIDSQEKIDKYEEKLKKIEANLDNGQVTKEDVFMIFEIVQELNIDSWTGLLAEEFQRNLLNKGLSSLVTTWEKNKFSPRVTGKDYWNFNITDVIFAKVQTQGIDTEIGLSQKFRNWEEFKISYSNIDIFHSLKNYANTKSEGESKITSEIQDMRNFFIFLRKNIMALSSWGIGQKTDSAFKVDEFITLDERLTFIRGFLRFFNGHVQMLESGQFSPFDSSEKLKDKMIFSAFLVTKNDVNWTLDFVEPILEAIDDKKGFDFNAMNFKWFSAKMERSEFPKIPQKMQKLIGAKRRRMTVLKQAGQAVTYKGLREDQDVSALIDQISKALPDTMIDSIEYKLNPNQF